MIVLAVIGELIFGFIAGTLVLWFCSFTVKTEETNIRTAAIYNAIMTVISGVLMVIALICVYTESGVAGWLLVIFTVLTLIVSFWLLMRMYDISVSATIWLVIAMWAVGEFVGKLVEFVT